MSALPHHSDPALPTLSTVAFRLTVATCLLFILGALVMLVQGAAGQVLMMLAMLAWLVASWSGLFGVAQAKPKKKAFNIFLFSLCGPLMTMLLTMTLLTLL